MSVRIEGFEELADRLADSWDGLETEDGKRLVSVHDLFPPDFMHTYTEFESVGEFFEESPWTIETERDFERIPPRSLDRYVDQHSRFDSWDTMLLAGGREWASRRVEP